MAGWGVIVPVKLLALAKTRLSAYGDAGRAELALAFAGDVLDAVLDCALVVGVLVVTDDVRAAAALDRPGATVVPDVPAAGLNAALEHGEQLLRRGRPDLPVAALSSDLPALRGAELASALGSVALRGFAADAAGSGTTLLAARQGALAPSYGAGSRARHLASGAVELDAGPGLRRDVDTPEDLRAALRLGVGPRTLVVAARLPAAS